MRTFNRIELLFALEADVLRIETVIREELASLHPNTLLESPAPGKWSIAQCLDHLNGYGHFYLPRLDAAISKAENRKSIPPANFKSSWLGNYFTGIMKPKEDGTLKSKMQSPKDHRPSPQLDVMAVMTEALKQQQQMLALLKRAEKVGLQDIKVHTSLSKWIRLSAGDTFRFLIAHEQRHILQSLRAKATITGGKTISPAILLAI